MRRGLAIQRLGAVVIAMTPSCTRPNPAHDGGGSGDGSASAEATTVEGPTSTSPDGSGSGEGSDSGGIPVCGDGVLADSEECDDGNAIDGDGCSASCQRTDEVDWLVEFEPVAGAEHDFRAAAQLEGDLLAAGRARLEGEPAPRAVVVRFDRDTGEAVEVAGFEGPYLESAAFGLYAAPPRLYIAGTAQHRDLSHTAIVACLDVGESITFATCWSTEVSGHRGRGLMLHEGNVFTALSNFDEAGYGVAVTGEDGSTVSWVVESPVGTSQFDAVAVVSGLPAVGGMVEADAVVAHAGNDSGSALPFITTSGTGTGRDRVQAMLALESDVILGGWKDQEGTGRDAWAGRYGGMDGVLVWSWSINGGSFDGDEVEALTLDPEGYVIAVGMMGNPSVPRVWKIDPANGDVIWSRIYPQLGPYDAFFRGVVVDEAIFVVGERRVGGGSVGIAARLPA